MFAYSEKFRIFSKFGANFPTISRFNSQSGMRKMPSECQVVLAFRSESQRIFRFLGQMLVRSLYRVAQTDSYSLSDVFRNIDDRALKFYRDSWIIYRTFGTENGSCPTTFWDSLLVRIIPISSVFTFWPLFQFNFENFWILSLYRRLI